MDSILWVRCAAGNVFVNNLLINGFCSSGLVHPPIRTTIIIIDLQKVCLENIISLLFLLKEFVQYCDIPRADFFDIL